MFIRCVLSACTVFVLALPAKADVADYCAAYARDHADQGAREKPIWQKRYDNALQTCGEQFSLKEPVAIAKKPVKPVIKVVAEKPKPVEKSETPVEPDTAKPKKVAAIPNLEAGSPEWVTYCKNKYVSFNEEKGTYLSKTGIERKCLVTAD
jgi:cell division septation protein DedD